jgi:hypothetical protein
MFKSFEDYISNNTQSQRQAHIDLATECCFTGKSKEYTSKRRSQDAARKNIVKYLIEQGILDISLLDQKFGKTGEVQVNHKCSCHSGNNNEIVCNNPLHLYLGTQNENIFDINPNTGKTARETCLAIFKTEEHKAKRSEAQKEAWLKRKLLMVKSDKE